MPKYSLRKYSNRWGDKPEQDDRLIGIEAIMIATCVVLDAIEGDIPVDEEDHAEEVVPLLTPLGLAEAMEAAAARIRRATATNSDRRPSTDSKCEEMNASHEKLSCKQEEVIAALHSGATVAMAAVKAGVSKATICGWFNKPDFVARYREGRRAVVEEAVAHLEHSSWEASATLIGLLVSPNESVRLGAARTILDQANQGLELLDALEVLDFEERLSALERQSNRQAERSPSLELPPPPQPPVNGPDRAGTGALILED